MKRRKVLVYLEQEIIRCERDLELHREQYDAKENDPQGQVVEAQHVAFLINRLEKLKKQQAFWSVD